MNKQIEQIRAEIERLKYPTSIKEAAAIQDVLNDLLAFIDSLPDEQPEVDLKKEYKEYVEDDPVFSKLTNRNVGMAIARHFYELGQAKQMPEEQPSKDLEEAAGLYLDNHKPLTRYNWGDLMDAFKAGAEWQAERLLKGSPMPEDTVIFQKGVDEGKRLMMEDYPKWHKVQQGSCFDKHTNFLLSAREGHFYCSSMEVPRDGYILLVDELERLPKEDEK